jgi:hypothetical protein
LPKIEEDGKSWLRRPKLCTKSCRATKVEEELLKEDMRRNRIVIQIHEGRNPRCHVN